MSHGWLQLLTSPMVVGRRPAGLGNKLEADALTSRTLEREVPLGTGGVGQIFEGKSLGPWQLGRLEQT